MNQTARKQETEQQLPEDHQPFTDKYFIRTNDILKAEGLNPEVSMKVFARGGGKIAGLEDAVEVLKKYSDLDETGEVWVAKDDEFQTKEPLMVVKGPIQSFVELETMYLGVISDALTSANELEAPDLAQVKSNLEQLAAVYKDKPMTYFGARHYHWSLDKDIAAAALEGGAVQTSSDMGSSNIGKKGVGTTPHVLTLVLASKYGKENATLKTAELFDKYMDPAIPRVTLVDTFNREIADSLAVARYFGKRKNMFRLDTCGENVGEGGTPYTGNEKGKDPNYQVGTGVTIELATNLRDVLVENGYGDNTGIFLSSGFGNEKKARAFVEADQAYKAKTGYNLFEGTGLGEVYPAMFATADLFEVDGRPLSKTGREVGQMDYNKMERVMGR